jgi:hypothetical protein
MPLVPVVVLELALHFLVLPGGLQALFAAFAADC